MKNASSSVVKSAYDTSQRSAPTRGVRRRCHQEALTTCSGEATRPDASTDRHHRRQAAHRLREQARVHAPAHRHHRFENELAPAADGQRALAQAAGERQQEQVGEAEAVHRGDERHRHALAEGARRRQAAHDVNEPEHGAEDAEGRRVAGRRLEDPRRLVVARLAGAHFGGQQIAQQRRLHAVHRQRQAVAQEVVVHAIEVGFEREHAVAVRADRPWRRAATRGRRDRRRARRTSATASRAASNTAPGA